MSSAKVERARFTNRKVWVGDADALATKLRSRIKGEVRFDAGSRALYATDASNYREVPIGVVTPTNAEDIAETVSLAQQYGVPILCRGGGTSLAGQCCNVALVMDMSKYYNRLLELNKSRKVVRVQPGIVLDELRSAARKVGLTFGPDPATHNHCTIGGMLGNNSCGVHSLMAQFYGPGSRMTDNTLEMEVLTYDGLRLRVGPTSDKMLDHIIGNGGRRGAIYAKLKTLRDKYANLVRARYPKIPRRVSGYNLDDLLPENGFNVARALIGSEGTCVTILEATLQLVDEPKKRSLLVLGYPSVYEAADHIAEILAHKPIGLEGLDDLLIGLNIKRGINPESIQLPQGHGWLLVEFGGPSKEQSDAAAAELMDELASLPNAPSMKLFDNPQAEKLVWEVRESGLGATAFVPGMKDSWPGWEDSAVPPEKLGPYLRALRALFNKYDYHPSLYGHFGQGCVHCRVDFDLYTYDGLKKYHSFLNEASTLVLSYGGSLSGEHGDGQSRAELLPKMFGPELVEAFREFKAIWDPHNKMNPGKVVDPDPIISNLRLGPDYNPWAPKTHFKFRGDHGSFARAALRCVGVGKCRRTQEGTMCPSYKVTREEEHSTRGRAHLLFEILRGEVLKTGWRDHHVHESLDLCLSCKGCKSDCPVNVDIATYKAEFLSHYYQGRLRPRSAYAMGLIDLWAQIASRIPNFVNYFTHHAPFAAIAKWMGGIAQEREIPRLAQESFKHWFAHRQPVNVGAVRVILWPDTFNNHFFPETLKAAVEVLEQAGFQVLVPAKSLCCGRPLYDYGMLDRAEKLLLDILDTLRPQIQVDTPLVALEPSCLAVFRDELINLFPSNNDAQRLSKNSFTLAEFFQKHAPQFKFPQLLRTALVHGHCHQKALMGLDCEETLFKRIGLEARTIDSGCCGMAGSFGFEKEKYDISVKCGELALLPTVRATPNRTLIIADGFSCREQIRALTRKKPLHTAEVLQMALHEKPQLERHPAEREFAPSARRPRSRALVYAGVTAAAALGAITGFFLKRRNKQ